MSYRSAGADPPFSDLRRAHGIGFEGHYWRFAGAGWSVAAIAAVCADARGARWGMVTLCMQPGNVERTRIAAVAQADRERFGVRAGPLLTADERSLTVDLGADMRLRADFAARRDWPRSRPFGALGPAQLAPGLGQYWSPHLLGARVRGAATLGARTLALDGASVYAEKNWGAAFAERWWWGQAALDGGAAGVAFAGGRVRHAGVAAAPTAVCAWRGDGGLVALAPPLARTVARVGGGEWQIRASSARFDVILEGQVELEPLRLPVPLPAARTLEPRSDHHLAGELRVSVRRGRRLWLRGTSRLAALEAGRAER